MALELLVGKFTCEVWLQSATFRQPFVLISRTLAVERQQTHTITISIYCSLCLTDGLLESHSERCALIHFMVLLVEDLVTKVLVISRF